MTTNTDRPDGFNPLDTKLSNGVNLLINPQTKLHLRAYLKKPTHALLLTGQKGVGLGSLAKALATEVAGSQIIIIEPKLHKTQKTANINVKDIRDLAQMTRTRRSEPLVIVIDEIEKMTAGAPEAFLKALEEPVSQVFYILTSHHIGNLPKTVLSRVQKIEVLPTSTVKLTSTIIPQTKQRQIEFIANGLPAEIQRLSGDELYFREKARLFEQAKTYLNSSTYEKLMIVPKMKNREATLDFLFAVSKLVQTKPISPKTLAVLSQVIDNISQNGNIKAQLTYLATNW